MKQEARLNVRKNLNKAEDEVIESLYGVFEQLKEMVKNNYITPKQGMQYIDNLSRIVESTSSVIDELIFLTASEHRKIHHNH